MDERYQIQKIQKKIEEKRLILGSHVGFDSPFVTEMIANQGFDFIWIDAEHSALDKKDIQTHLLACRAAGAAGIVRVPWNDHTFIKGILDMGADGVIIPMICSYQDARSAVAATHYPPLGIRGMGTRRACGYGEWDKASYVADTDRHVWTILQIEHIDVVKDLDRIAALPGVSAFVVGPNDFSMSMNTAQRSFKPGDPEVKEQIDKIAEILRKSGKPFGVSGAYSEQFVRDWIGRGVDFIAMGFDFNFVVNGAKTVMTRTKSLCDAINRTY